MALAPFFDKAALAAATILHGFDREAFASLLEAQLVEIAFDEQAAASHEGRVALELVTNLIARLYPRIRITASGADDGLIERLDRLARSINPHIEFAPGDFSPTVAVVVGRTCPPEGPTSVIYVGSDGWIAELSTKRPVGCGDSLNPFGAAAAACFAVANVFRVVFRAQLPAAELDDALRMSLLDLDPTNPNPTNPELGPVRLDDVHLVGAGAIGSGFVWSLARASVVTGTLQVVDGELLDGTNSQRYVIALPTDRDSQKTQLAVREFACNGSVVAVQPHGTSWGRYLTLRESTEPLHVVAVALDSARDRIGVQASLPRKVFNAWTQAGDLGVSRHQFGSGACLACLYVRDAAAKNEDQLVAEAIGLPAQVREVRELLHSGRPAGPELIKVIAEALGVDSASLMPFADRPLRSFYAEAVCGGLLMRLGATVGGTEVPLAFQSALAGVLLAVAVVADAAGLPKPNGTKAVIDLLRPLGSHLTVPIAAHASGLCLCQDPDYLARYVELHLDSVCGEAPGGTKPGIQSFVSAAPGAD